jgi:hypothetical protein
MAQEMVVREPFTEQMKIAGEELLRALDASGFVVTSAFWWFDADASDWRLVIATPGVDIEGPRESYVKIQNVLYRNESGRPEFGLQNITVASPTYPAIQMLRSALGPRPGISSIRITRSRMNDLFVEDAYIYRL